MGVTSYDPTSNVKRPESGKTKTIHQNQAISGIKQVHPTAVKPDLNTEGPLNSTGQFTIGALENSSLLGPAASNPLKIIELSLLLLHPTTTQSSSKQILIR